MPIKFTCKKQPASIKIFDSINDLPVIWDNTLPLDHHLHSKQLSLYEKVKLPDIKCYYVLLGNESEIQTMAYFQLLDVLPKHLNTNILGGYQATLAPLCLNLFKPSLLVAGHLFRHDVVNFFSKGLSAIDAFRAYESMIQSLGKHTGAMAYLIKDVPENLVQYFTNFAPNYTLLRNDIAMKMVIPANWENFDDYERALKHKYAQKCRKVRAAFSDIQILELNAQQVSENAATIYELYLQVSRKQSISLGLLNKDFLPMLKAANDESLKIWAFYNKEGKMVAFASAWVQSNCFDMFYIGFDYEQNHQYNLYFNILYFSIEQAIIYKKPMLHLGRTALEAKARLGCLPRYLPTFLFVRNVCIRALVNSKINQQHDNEGAWEERHPFKK